jgi:hypothetical protein
MATTYKVLGQASPANTNNADLYTVGAGKQAVVSTLQVANVNTEEALIRVFVRIAGAAAAASNAVAWDVSVPGNSVLALTTGMTLGATDVITVRSSVANALTISLFGSEIA